MNILMIIIFGILLVSIWSGYRKGFLKTAFSLVSWVLVLVICNAATPMVKDILMEQTDMQSTIQMALDQKINEMISEAMQESGAAEIQEGISNGLGFQIPEQLKGVLPEEINSMLTGETWTINPENSFVVTAKLTEYIVGIIALLIVLVFSRIAIMVVNLVLGIAAKLPLIGASDKFLGLFCGAGKGLIWSWIVLTIVFLVTLTGNYMEWNGYIADSQILTWMQENNLILNLLLK